MISGTKRVEQHGQVILHQRYLYRDYLQIAAFDLTRTNQPALWFLTWDPTQPVATRPLAIRTANTWYLYGWDLTKNITELYTPTAQLDTDYVYTPYGTVRTAGNITQPIQWSSEYHDPETALIYYNFRYYNPLDGRWTRRDPIKILSGKYTYLDNSPILSIDHLGLFSTLHIGILEGVVSGTISTEEAIAILGSLVTLISIAKAKGLRAICKPCIPPVGTKMEEKHTTHSHNNMCPHYHVFEVMQSPPIKGCICFAPRPKAYSTSQGYRPYVYPTGGGVQFIS